MKRLTNKQINRFQQTVYGYYRRYGRNDLPWRKTRNPYSILVSEVMLQQTQVARVMTKYRKFIRRFPTVRVLARSRLRNVLRVWSGLGYNRRALALKRTAEVIQNRFSGRVPRDIESLVSLPGIGETTACAVQAFAFNLPTVFIETNIRTVFIHFFGGRRRRVTDTVLRPLLQQTLDTNNPRTWFFALMDYGAMLKKKYPNPSRRSAHHTTQARFEGSNRQTRGLLVKVLTRKNLTFLQIKAATNLSEKRLRAVLSQLKKEDLVKITGQKWGIV